MPDEQVDIFDENYKPAGRALKSEARKDGLWVHSFHCWILRRTEPGYVLFQKRGSDKTIYPDALDITAAGHYKAGERIPDGMRELHEELRLDVSFHDLVSLGVKIDVGAVGPHIVREFCHVFILPYDAPPSEYNPDGAEVEGLVEIALPDGLALFANEARTARASGIEFNKSTGRWTDIALDVTIEQFIPRVDPYYYKVFIMADRYLKGDRYVAI